MAFALRLAGLRDVVERFGERLGTMNFSSLAPALVRACSLRLIRLTRERLEAFHAPRKDQLVAIDSMSITVQKTQRHRMTKFNNRTAGGGVLWTFTIEAARGVSPVRILKVMQGAWSDAKAMADAEVVLGGPRAKRHPRPRVIGATLANGEPLIVLTDRMDLSAEQLLAAYRKRGRIEEFHRLVNDAVGLAHLYSFSAGWVEFLLRAALMLALLLYLDAADPSGDTVNLPRRQLHLLKCLLGLGRVWKRNSCIRPRSVKRQKTIKRDWHLAGATRARQQGSGAGEKMGIRLSPVEKPNGRGLSPG